MKFLIIATFLLVALFSCSALFGSDGCDSGGTTGEPGSAQAQRDAFDSTYCDG